MFYLAILLMVIICLFSYFFIDKKTTSPAFILPLEWTIFIFFYHFNVSGFNKISDKTYWIIIIGVFSYVFGAAIIKKTKSRHIEAVDVDKQISQNNNVYNKYILYALMIITFAYCIWKFTQTGIDIISGKLNFGEVRVTWLGEGGLQNAREETIYNCLILPGLYTNIIVAAVNFSLKRIQKVQTIITLICVGLVVLFSGARMIVFDLIIAVLFGALLVKRKFKISLTKKRKIMLIMAVLVIFFILDRISQDRQGVGIIQVAIGNFSLSIPLLDYVVKMTESTGDLTYGLIFFRGIMSLPLIALSIIGIDLWPIQYQILSKYTNPFFPIGHSVAANAYVTTFFYFWLDARWIGVIIMSMAFGAITQKIYYRAQTANITTDKGQCRIAFYLFSLVPVWRTFFNFSYSNTTFTITFILIFLVYNGIKFKHVSTRGGVDV